MISDDLEGMENVILKIEASVGTDVNKVRNFISFVKELIFQLLPLNIVKATTSIAFMQKGSEEEKAKNISSLLE